jgi:hypothetical protein
MDLVEACLDLGLIAEYHLEMVVEVVQCVVDLMLVLDQRVVMEVRG